MVVKLTRVVLLAPLIAVVSLWHRRTVTTLGARGRPPLMPLFVVGFLAAMSLRSIGVRPAPFLEHAKVAQTVLLAAAMFGMGASVRPATLIRSGNAGLVLGLISSVLIAAVSYLGIVALT